MSNNDLLIRSIVEGTDVSEYKCRTRTEHFLKKCACGEVCEDLTPRTRTEELLYELSKKIAEGGSGGGLNIHYSSTEAPEDTTKLWVKADIEPSKVSVGSNTLPTVVGKDANPSIKTLTTTLPRNVSMMGTGTIGAKVYLFGGYDVKVILEFDSESKTITTLETTLPYYLRTMGTGVVDNKIYLFGGISDSYSNAILEFDSESKTITTLETTLPIANNSMGTGTIGTKVYLFGGYQDKTSIVEFDSESKNIKKLTATLPTDNSGMGAVAIDNKVYLFGGKATNYLDTILEFDSETNTIKTLDITLPKANQNMGIGKIGNKVYLFGGMENDKLNTIVEFDSESKNITTLDITLPSASYCMGTGVVDTTIYLFGGYANTQKTIVEFGSGLKLYYKLNSNDFYIDNRASSLKCKLINSDTLDISVGVEKCYLGNSDNVAEEIKVAIHNGTEWQEI